MDIYGIPIYENPHCFTTEPVRVHKAKPGRLAYHLRIQKKWNKRFGTKQVPAFFITNLPGRQAIFSHPSLIEQIRLSLTTHPQEGDGDGRG